METPLATAATIDRPGGATVRAASGAGQRSHDGYPSAITLAASLALVTTLVLGLIARRRLRRRHSRVHGRSIANEVASTAPAVIAPLADPPPPGTAYVVATTPDGTPLHFPLTHPVIHVGRAAGSGPTIVLDPSVLPSAQSVSEQHVRVELDGREHILVDLGSTNGVLVNGHRASDVVLYDGTHILLGSLGMVYRANGLGGGVA